MKNLRENVQELRKTKTMKEVAKLLNISIFQVAYYSENADAYRQRKSKERKLFLENLKKEFGGKCCKCGYCKNFKALSFHHLDSSIKEHEVADLARNSRFTLARTEAKKCVLMCANCHMEIHNPEN